MARSARPAGPAVPAAPQLDVTGRPIALRDVDLDRFFHPRTVAVIGASDTPRRPNTAMWTKIRAWGEKAGASVIPVNPGRDTLDGVRCYPSIHDVPGDIDLAVILVGAAVEMFETVLERKPAFAVIFSAGFAEVGPEGEALQERLATLVASGETRLLGPNTNLNAFETFRDDLGTPKVALITQSGHQGRPIFQAQDLGLPLCAWAPTGNEVDLEFADFARYFADQPDIGVIAAYIEGFKDGRTLMLAADHAAARGTPIVCVKVGRTDEGASMAKSHTGHLTGRDEVTDAAFRQYGVTRVEALDELLDVSMLLSRAKAPTGDGVCIYAISGGTGAHMADMASAAGLRLPDLTAKTQKALHQWIPEYLRVSNPVDCGGPPTADERGRKILDAIVADPNVDVLIVPITGALASMSMPFARDLVAVAETTDKPVCVIWGAPTSDDRAYTEVLLPSRLPVFRTFGNCVTAVKAYLDWHAFLARHTSPFAKPVLRRSPASAKADPRWATAGADGTLAEHDAKALLADYGIAVTHDVLCGSAAEAARAAAAMGGPVVLKVASPDFAHKSDLGLVAVGVDGAAAVKRSYAALMDRAAAAAAGLPRTRKRNARHASHGDGSSAGRPSALGQTSPRIDGVLVCEMVTGGIETVVGVSTDELFGPVVMFGLGGVFVEVFGDVAFRVPPFDRAEVRRMIAETKGAKLLAGARGRPAADVAALVDVILKVQRLALDHAGALAELDINPLVVLPKGAGRPGGNAIALDALAIRR